MSFMNDFEPSENILFFKLIIDFLKLKNALKFWNYCIKYTTTFEDENLGLLYLYKQLYHRDYGSIRFKYKKKCKLTPSQQIKKLEKMEQYKANLMDYRFWKQKYEYKLNPISKSNDNAWYIAENIHPRRGDVRLSILCHDFDKNECRDISCNDILIITKSNICNPFQLLNIKHFNQSNWYQPFRRYSRRRNYPRSPRFIWTYNDIEYMQYYGFRNIVSSRIVHNIPISSAKLISNYDITYVFPVRYEEKLFYLKEIKCIDHECCFEKRKCILKTTEYEEDIMSDELEVEGIIFNHITKIKWLESKLYDKSIENKELRVKVYLMGLNTTTSCDEAEQFEKTYNKIKYIVMGIDDQEFGEQCIGGTRCKKLMKNMKEDNKIKDIIFGDNINIIFDEFELNNNLLKERPYLFSGKIERDCFGKKIRKRFRPNKAKKKRKRKSLMNAKDGKQRNHQSKRKWFNRYINRKTILLINDMFDDRLYN